MHVRHFTHGHPDLVSLVAVQQQEGGRQLAAGKQHTALVPPGTAATVHQVALAVHIAVVGMPAEVGAGMPAGCIPVGVEVHTLVEEVVDNSGHGEVLGVAAGGHSLHGKGVDILPVAYVVEAAADTVAALWMPCSQNMQCTSARLLVSLQVTNPLISKQRPMQARESSTRAQQLTRWCPDNQGATDVPPPSMRHLTMYCLCTV